MKVSIYGVGYVGLVTAACLAEVGNHVVCYDIDQTKLAQLQQGQIPIHERGLTELVQRNTAQGRLVFTDQIDQVVKHGVFHFIAVGTPTGTDGQPDLRYVNAVANTIAEHLNQYAIVITKSTVPVGTTERVAGIIDGVLQQRGVNVQFDVLSNPEFLKEGDAVRDFMRPDRVIIGANNQTAALALKQLYAPFNRNSDRVIIADIRSAELTKYAANAMLALKISFMNEFSTLAALLGADIESVRKGIAADPRIGPHFIYAGCGYGGSCFPKDVRAVISMAQALDCDCDIIKAVDTVNERQKQIIFAQLSRYFSGDLTNKTIAVWGLAFKPNTDDIREAACLSLLDGLFTTGAKVQAYDPAAMSAVRQHYADHAQLKLCPTAKQALVDADVLVVMTEWNEFRTPDFGLIKRCLRHAAIFDGRNLYSPSQLADLGIAYYAIGRGLSI